MENWIIQGTVVNDEGIVLWNATVADVSFTAKDACEQFIHSTDSWWLSTQQYVLHLAEQLHAIPVFACIQHLVDKI